MRSRSSANLKRQAKKNLRVDVIDGLSATTKKALTSPMDIASGDSTADGGVLGDADGVDNDAKSKYSLLTSKHHMMMRPVSYYRRAGLYPSDAKFIDASFKKLASVDVCSCGNPITNPNNERHYPTCANSGHSVVLNGSLGKFQDCDL